MVKTSPDARQYTGMSRTGRDHAECGQFWGEVEMWGKCGGIRDITAFSHYFSFGCYRMQTLLIHYKEKEMLLLIF